MTKNEQIKYLLEKLGTLASPDFHPWHGEEAINMRNFALLAVDEFYGFDKSVYRDFNEWWENEGRKMSLNLKPGQMKDLAMAAWDNNNCNQQNSPDEPVGEPERCENEYGWRKRITKKTKKGKSMRSEIERSLRFHLILEEQEAAWLRGLVQNQLHEEETEEDSIMRQRIFNALSPIK